MAPDRTALRNALITAEVAEDEGAQALLLDSMAADDLAPLCGSLLAMTGNLVKMLAAVWGCTPSEAWEQILTTARELGLQ